MDLLHFMLYLEDSLSRDERIFDLSEEDIKDIIKGYKKDINEGLMHSEYCNRKFGSLCQKCRMNDIKKSSEFIKSIIEKEF